MKKQLPFFLVFLLSLLNISGSVISFGPRLDRGLIQNNELAEISGLALSGWDSDVLWTHNDSGSENAIYALNTSGVHLAKYYLTGINFRDMEDIASGELNGLHYLFLADIGDNNGTYNNIYIYRILEPEVSSGQVPFEGNIAAVNIEMISLHYPAGAHYDAETVFAEQSSGDIYVVTKRNPANPYSGTVDHVFLAAYPQSTVTSNLLTEIATLDVATYMNYGITAGDLSPSGRELLLKTYSDVYYWEIEPGSDISEALQSAPEPVNYELEPQGEALCWSSEAGGYYCSSEEAGGYPAHLSYYARLSSYIRISALPTGLYRANEEMQIIWSPQGLYNQLYTSSMPGGEILENYTASGVWGEDILVTTPAELGLSVSVYRGILHNPEYDYLSIEFPIIVEAGEATQMTYPPNGATISEPMPIFQWEVNPGVPYYLIGVSDTPFVIEHDENGDAMVTGIETVWQVLTYDTALMYGMPDPSGYFENSAPPLIPGNEYNWIVINCYGNDPLLSSKVVGSPFAFYFDSENTIPSVQLLTPGYYEPLSSAEINFSWTEVTEAMYYQIQVFEIHQQGGNSGNYLVWDQVTTNTDIDMNASSILINADYNWKVYATSSEEVSSVSSVSEQGHFIYDIAVGTLALHIRDNYGSPVPFATAEIDPITGSSDNFPLAINENGNEDKTIPVGEYLLEVSKEGFEPRDTIFVIEENQTTQVTVEMIYSPAYFYGRVTDTSGYVINNAIVNAEDSYGNERTVTAVNGNYLMAVTPDTWTLKANKQGWLLLSDQVAGIEAGENLQLPDLVMTESSRSIQGYVRNSSALPLMRVHVSASSGGTEYYSLTDANGFYSFSGVNFGQYLIQSVKPGYTALNEETIVISPASPAVTSVPDIILQPAAMVNGTARNGVVGLKNVTVTAIPAMGNPINTITDDYGDYQLNLLAGTYNMCAYREHYSCQTTYQISLATSETLDNLDFVLLPNNALIRGTVLSENNPLPDVLITAGDSYTLTGEDGNYELSIYPGTYTLTAYRQGYTVNRSYRISLSPEELVENINFEMYPNASIISGTVHHQGTIIAAADVFAQKQSGNFSLFSTTSNNQGNYGFSFSYGSYKLWAAKQNFVCLPQDTVMVTVAPGEMLTDIDINLTPIEAYINGRIISSQGIGIEGAEITATSGELLYSTISGSYGNFRLTVEPARSYEIYAFKAGYSANTAVTGILEIAQQFYLEIILTQMPSTISGRVYDQAGMALADATVTAEGEAVYSTLSGINGSWLLSLFAGDYTVTAVKPGYLEDFLDITLTPGSQLDSLDFYLQENFAVLEGYVMNENSGEPLADVLISASYSGGGGSSGYTDAAGYYSLDGLIPGLYESILYSKAGYYGHIEANRILPGSYTTVIDVLLEPFEAAIEANVTYAGAGMAGATVAAENQISGETVSAVTNASGYSLLTGITSLMPYVVSVSLTNYAASDTLVYPIPADTLQLVFELLRIDGTISGFVHDQNGNAVNGATVRAQSLDGYVSSDITGVNGTYLLEDLATNREYELTVNKPGYSQGDELVVFLSDDPLQVDIVIYAHNYQASGILVDQEGYELPGIQVYCQGVITGAQTESGTDGSFLLQPLAPFSTYNFWTLADENGYENINWQDTLVTANLDFGEVILPVHTSQVLGTLTDSYNGQPVSGAIVTAASQQSGQTAGAVSQPDGSYRIRYLYEGYYQLQVLAENYSPLVLDSIYVPHREDLLLDLELQYNEPLQISGMVMDTNGRIYTGIPVDLLTGSTTYTRFTEDDGSFSFSQAPPYSQVIVTTSLPVNYYDNDWLELETEAEDISGLLLEIDLHNASVSGYISGIEGFLANATVIIANPDTMFTYTTQSNGYYAFNRLYEGSYELSCSRPGYELFAQQLNINDYDALTHNIYLNQVADAISGIVHSATETGLANAIVKVWQGDVIIDADTTLASGAFQIDYLAITEEYQITANKLGFLSYTHPDPVIPGSPALDIILQSINNSLSGSVYYQNQPYPGAIVKIRDPNSELQQTECNDFGDYLFTNINGYFDVWAEAGEELTSIAQGVVIPAGGSQRFHTFLVEAASIRGLALYLNNPKPGVTVTATNIASGRWAQDITEEDGIYELRGLAPGTYNLVYYCEGYQFIDPPQEVSVSHGEIVELPDVHLMFLQNAISGVVQRINTRLGISGALVTLADSLHIPIDVYVTAADGTFLFSPLADGVYYLQAQHPAYYEAEEIEVTLAGGIQNPPTADFNLVHKELYIYGYVHTDNNQPVEGAIVTAELSRLTTHDSRFTSSRLPSPVSRSISDTTDASGYYEIIADTIGVWQLSASCDDYYPAENMMIELDWQQSWYQQNFYLQPVILYADISGSIKIMDESWQPLDSYNLRLQSLSGIDIILEGSSPDSTYLFSDLVITDVFSLELSGSYYSHQYYELRQDIEIQEESILIEDFMFTWVPDTWDWQGYIYMKNNGLQPLPGAEIRLSAAGGEEYVQHASQKGYYLFSSLLEDDYIMRITAQYDEEEFTYTSPSFHFNTDHQYDHFFQYFLCELGISVSSATGIGLPGISARLSNEEMNLTMVTDQYGYCTSGALLHTGAYSLRLSPSLSADFVYLVSPAETIILDTLGYHQLMRVLPLWFDQADYEDFYNYNENISILLYKAGDFQGNALLHYLKVNGSQVSLTMDSSEGYFQAEIPAQNAAGNIEFWFTALDTLTGVTYSSASYHQVLEISAAGIPSAQFSRILPEDPLLPYATELLFELQIFDLLGNNLSESVAAEGTIEWTINNGALGSLSVHPDNHLLLDFSAAILGIPEIEGQITAMIDYEDFYLEVNCAITLGTFSVASVNITGPYELRNSASGIYNVQIFTGEGRELTLPFQVIPVSSFAGDVKISSGSIIYEPDDFFIGKTALQAVVTDPLSLEEYKASFNVTIYELINAGTSTEVLTTGLDCEVQLYEQMLQNPQYQAKLYMNPRNIPPYEEVDISYETRSSVFRASSDLSESAFSQLPGLSFTSSEPELLCARWNDKSLTWEILNPLAPEIEHITHLAKDYAALAASRKLGIYDLKLLPNPFTPYDQVGVNPGLQISFRISSQESRFVKISAAIYTVNGELVRQLATAQTMLKGEYAPGELNTLYWDGYTDKGAMARNGRYLLHLIAEDSTGRQEALRTLVLIK
ncbi:MAG: carboxypeptidase-like regulatory domain-containing protein [Candidatus Cloacimonetes bacterium]|nr:carboxypeptidase-like regulatory domain-containing protein [Candidatus Cloacimonadota bacterium]